MGRSGSDHPRMYISGIDKEWSHKKLSVILTIINW
jgi:hypothetical protein